MEVKSEVKTEVKKEVKQKKIKSKKIRKPLNLSDLSTDEEENDSKEFFGKRHQEFKSRLAETRLHIEKSVTNDEELAEDVFTDNRLKTQTETKKSIKDKDLKEVLSLLDDLSGNSDHNHKTDNEVNDESIIEELEVSPPKRAHNTRSRGRGRGGKRGIPKKTTKKTTTRRKTGRKSKETEFDEQKAFERLDVMQAMDDIEVVEDLNTSLINEQDLNVSQELEEYIKDRDIEIKVKYKAVIEKFWVKCNEKFSKIMPLIADKFSENVSELVFHLNDSKLIDSETNPQSIGLTVSDIIVCHKRTANKSGNGFKDPNVVSLKLRDKTMKSSQTFNINKFDKIQTIVDWFSTFKGIPPKKFRLEFDGDRLDPDSTVAESDIEDDSQIDVILL